MKLTEQQRDLLRALGSEGGKKHSATLSPKQRQDRAYNASRARWDKPCPICQKQAWQHVRGGWVQHQATWKRYPPTYKEKING